MRIVFSFLRCAGASKQYNTYHHTDKELEPSNIDFPIVHFKLLETSTDLVNFRDFFLSSWEYTEKQRDRQLRDTFAKTVCFFYNITIMSMQKPFYEKFIKKPSSARTQDKRNQSQVVEKSRKHQSKEKDTYQKTSEQRFNQKNEEQSKNRRTSLSTFGKPIFAELTPEAKNILERFPALLDRILPLDAKKKQLLPQHIHTLFHELTDERGTRKTHYLNDPVKLSAYAHYYVWWNLVRLTKLLQNLDIRFDDGDYAVDFGSGPLTLLCALWIAKPALRKKQLTWYCVDISNKALSFGEELFLTLCAYTGQMNSGTESPWRIKKIYGAFGTPLTGKAALVTEANMFNEVFWNSPLSLDEQAEKTYRTVMQYLQPNGSVLFIEPGIPLAGEFLTLMRSLLLQDGFSIQAPCPHIGVCCLPNRRQHNTATRIPVAYNKWCHFTFETHDSPKKLLQLSEDSKLGKERASLSFIYGVPASTQGIHQEPAMYGTNYNRKVTQYPDSKSTDTMTKRTTDTAHTTGIPVRICSDIIKLDSQTIGRYACSEKGFMLITSYAYKESVLNTALSGTLLMLPENVVQPHLRDKKTNALLVALG